MALAKAEPDEAALRLVVGFAGALRRGGLEVPVGSVAVMARAVWAVGLQAAAPLYWAGRATVVTDPADVDAYDQAFRSFWLGIRAPVEAEPRAPSITLAIDDGPETPEGGTTAPAAGATVALRYSPTEILRRRDLAGCTPEELAEAYRLMAGVRVGGSLRPRRRREPSRRRRGHPDLRRTLRQAMRTGGEPARRAWAAPGRQPRRVVLLCDMSGSMEPYSRAFLRFLHAAVAGRSRVEAFALGTRLTRLTRELSWRDPDVAMARAVAAGRDWAGGTRLGEALAAFNDQWGIRGMARGAVVVVMSDGWDRGDPGDLGSEMARLHRVAHRVVWVNPLKASPGYAPVARGMAAALPHVDAFVEGHSLEALEDLVEVIAR